VIYQVEIDKVYELLLEAHHAQLVSEQMVYRRGSDKDVLYMWDVILDRIADSEYSPPDRAELTFQANACFWAILEWDLKGATRVLREYKLM